MTTGTERVTLHWVAVNGRLDVLLPVMAGATALLSAPGAFTIARVDDQGQCVDADGPIDVNDVFEARVFTPDRELRWVRRGDSGQGALLGESVGSLDPGAANRTGGGPMPDLEPSEIGYLLWGTPSPDADDGMGWRTLSAARIGSIRVPGSWPDQPDRRLDRLVLRAREYIGTDTDGNAHIVDERLVAIVGGTFADGDIRYGEADGG